MVSRERKSIIFRPFDHSQSRLLRQLNVDHQCLHGQRSFDVADCLSKIKCKLEYTDIKDKNISVRKQENNLHRILANPLRGAPVIGISSYPSDLRAKLVAAMIVASATEVYKNGGRKVRSRQLPVWHRIYGGFKDDLRDKPSDKPCLLVLTNITDDCSNIKIEKIRDLLEKYDDIPRIVVTGGKNPLNFFAERLKYPLRHGIYVGPERREDSIVDVLDL